MLQEVLWSDGLSDEWAFVHQDSSRGPATRGDLAVLHKQRLLKKSTLVHHVSQRPDQSSTLGQYVQQWQQDLFNLSGD